MGEFYSSICKQNEKRNHPSFQKIQMGLRRPRIVATALLLIVGILVSANATAYDFETDGIYYNITSEDDKTVEVTYNGDTSYSGEIVIPSSVINSGETYKVTKIGDSAFSYCALLRSVEIPNSIISIGSSAFSYSFLESVVIPNSVTEIGERAFRKCSQLYRVEIGSGITTIGRAVFSDCIFLQSVVIPNSVTTIGKYAFFNCEDLRSIEIPNSVTAIGECAFYGCSSLFSMNKVYSVNIPNGVTTIEASTFEECSSLSSVAIPDGVTTIGEKSFYGCSKLDKLEIGSGVTKIGLEAFAGAFLKTPDDVIICWTPTPPQFEGKELFDPLTYVYATLYVPIGAKEDYKAANGWNFMKIEEIKVSGVASVGSEAVSVAAEGGRIVVNGVDGNEPMEVYTAGGQLVYRGAASTISVANRGIYIVRVAGQVFKVAL